MNRETLITDGEELTFSRTILGYDPLEVRAFVREANERIARLSSPGTLTSDQRGAAPEPELSEAISSAVREIDEVLESARLAAERIRNTAEVDVSDSVESAHERARGIVDEAEEEAFTLRQVAWEAATEMLETVSSHVSDLRDEAERDALRIIDDAERRAIRELAAARRDSENILQTARVEHDRLIDLAGKASLEIGRRAPDDEVSESVDAPTKRLVVELRADRAPADVSDPSGASGDYSGIRVIPAGSTPVETRTEGESADTPDSEDDRAEEAGESAIRLGWADGTRSVRLVGTPATRARVEVDAMEMAREVARLRAGPETGGESENGESAAEVRPYRHSDPSEPAGGGDRSGPAGRLVATRSNGSDPGGGAPSGDDLADLFSRLRRQVRRSNSST